MAEEKKKRSKFTIIGEAIGELVTIKNDKYGDSFAQAHKFLQLLYPDGIPVENYSDMLALVRIFDKMKRIATDKNALGENPYMDIGGYSILALAREKDEAEEVAEDDHSFMRPQEPRAQRDE